MTLKEFAKLAAKGKKDKKPSVGKGALAGGAAGAAAGGGLGLWGGHLINQESKAYGLKGSKRLLARAGIVPALAGAVGGAGIGAGVQGVRRLLAKKKNK